MLRREHLKPGSKPRWIEATYYVAVGRLQDLTHFFLICQNASCRTIAFLARALGQQSLRFLKLKQCPFHSKQIHHLQNRWHWSFQFALSGKAAVLACKRKRGNRSKDELIDIIQSVTAIWSKQKKWRSYWEEIDG